MTVMSAGARRTWGVFQATLTLAMVVVILALPAQADEIDAAAAVQAMLGEARQEVEMITVDELFTRLQGDHDLTLVDVRTEAEYDAGHLRGARWIPRGKLEFLAAKELGSIEGEIVVYCKLDGRSCLAGKTLMEMGFDQVKYLQGGFEPWVTSGKSIFNLHGELVVRAFEKGENDE